MAELLICILILGEIATFTIPKIVSAQQIGKKKAVFKETIGALSAIYGLRVATGELTNSNAIPYVSSQLNAVKLCPVNSTTEGCMNTAKDGSTVTLAGLTLANGAQLYMYTGGAEDFLIDWNGDSPPNITGDDIIHVYGISTLPSWCNLKKGSISVPDPATCDTGSNYTLYRWIFE